jgi:hypothetical protein
MSGRNRLQRKFDEMMRMVFPFAEAQQIEWMHNAFFAGALAAYVESMTDPAARADLRAELEEHRDRLREEIFQMHLEAKESGDNYMQTLLDLLNVKKDPNE